MGTGQPGGTPGRDVVIVTGAASGIGMAVAEAFLHRGARVVAVDVDADGLRALHDARRARGWRAETVEADLRSSGAATGVVEDTLRRHGRIDALINNAGIMDGFVPLHDLDDELWRRVLAVNLDAPMAMIRAALPAMRAAGRGTIVNVASLAGLRGGAAGAAYTASKHALIGLTKHVAWLYGPDGVRCVALCPGAVATGMSLDGAHPEGLRRAGPVLAASPPPDQPADVAALALFLTTPAAAVVNGSAVIGDSGWSAG